MLRCYFEAFCCVRCTSKKQHLRNLICFSDLVDRGITPLLCEGRLALLQAGGCLTACTHQNQRALSKRRVDQWRRARKSQTEVDVMQEQKGRKRPE